MTTLAGIFVGGASRRMGGYPKGLLPAPDTGEALVVRAARIAREAGLEVVLVGDATAYTALSLPCVPDHAPGEGPLSGLIALLHHAAPQAAMALSCDAPRVRADTLARLAFHPAQTALVTLPGPLQPFPARYLPSRVLPVVWAAYARGERSLRRALAGLDTAILELDGNDVDTADWDTPDDLDGTARAWLTRERRGER